MFAHVRNNAVAYVALFVAMGGTAFAASQVTSTDIKNNTIKGKDIKTGQVAGSDLTNESATGEDVANGSLTGADLGNDSVSGGQVDESSLAKVANSDALDGKGSNNFGSGIVNGHANGISGSGAELRPAFGVSASGTTDDLAVFAVAPIPLEFRDFRAHGTDLGAAGEEIELKLAVRPIGASVTTTQLCTPSSVTGSACDAPTVIPIPKGASYWLDVNQNNLANPSNLAFAYRLLPD